MVMLYVNAIIQGRKTIEDVPFRFKDAVKKELEAQERG